MSGIISDINQSILLSVLPPGQDELPCDDGIPMETQRHKLQMDLLIDPLAPWLAQRQGGGYVGGNMFVYFSVEQVRNQDYRGPDVFVVLDVAATERKSWVVWEEGRAPNVVIELLSASTATRDKTEKKRIHQSQMRVPEYVWYDPFNPNDLAGFSLQKGVYEPIALDDGRLISQSLGLALVRWRGAFKGVEDVVWLRWATVDGVLLPTDREQAEQEHQRAEQERQRADRLTAQLRELGIEPDEIPKLE